MTVGLEVWCGYFQQHLSGHLESVARLRAITADDLQRMAKKAGFELEEIAQVLDKLHKPTASELKERKDPPV